MEFGIFLNGYLPGPASRDTECEHTMIFREMSYVEQADKFNWKYAWFGEHTRSPSTATCRRPR